MLAPTVKLSYVRGLSQERSRTSTYKLEEHSQQGLVKDGNHLGGSRGGSSKQIRMASECMWPNASTWMWVESRSGSINGGSMLGPGGTALPQILPRRPPQIFNKVVKTVVYQNR